MKKWKTGKNLLIIISLISLFLSFGMAQGAEKKEPLSMIATTFPAYDFAMQLTGDEAEVRLLLPPGSESHSYEPTPRDIIAIQNADLFLTVGGESEHWVTEMLNSMGEQAPRTLAMMDCVTVLAQEKSHSMQEDEHTHTHTHAHTHSHEEDMHINSEVAELDEHVWTSPKRAKEIVLGISAVLIELRPDMAEEYQGYANAYLLELDALDKAFETIISQGTRQKIIFGDRFPFRYLAHDYAISYDAAFPGCSEDSEPNPQTIISLIREVQAEEIPVVFYIEFSNRKTADILAEETGAALRLFHSCHNVTTEEMENGATYLSLMQGNLEMLKEALE